MGSKAVCCVAEYAFCFGYVSADLCEDICPKFKDADHEGYWYVVSWIVRVSFVGFVDEFCCDGASFLGCIAVLCHQLEEMDDHVVCGVWEFIFDFVGDGVGAGGFPGSRSLASSLLVASCEMLVQC